MKIAFQMDPIMGVDINADSSFRLAEEAQKRGHELFYYGPDQLAYQEGRITARGHDMVVQRVAGTPAKLGELREVDLADYAAEWKWDGIRVQVVHTAGKTRVYSRSGDDISDTFPEIADALPFPAVLDGELLVRGTHQGGEEGGAASFNALQQRLGRKTVSARMQREYPAFVRLYDVLLADDQDLRELGWSQRRAALESLMNRLDGARFDLSSVIQAADFATLSDLRDRSRDDAIEGIMLN